MPDVEDVGHELSVVLERGGYEFLSESGWLSVLQLDGQVEQIGDSAGVGDIWDTREILEERRIDHGIDIFIVIREEAARALETRRGNDQRSFGISGGVRIEPVEGVVDGGVGGQGIDCSSAPHLPMREGVEVEACDDAEVVAAAAEREEEVWVCCGVDVNDCAVC